MLKVSVTFTKDWRHYYLNYYLLFISVNLYIIYLHTSYNIFTLIDLDCRQMFTFKIQIQTINPNKNILYSKRIIGISHLIQVLSNLE